MVLTFHSLATDYASLMVLRTILGALESVISPGFSLITSMWYTPREHVSRHSFWFAGNASASLIGSLVSYGILDYHGDFAKWRVSLPPKTSHIIPLILSDSLHRVWNSHRAHGICLLVVTPRFCRQRIFLDSDRANFRNSSTKEVPTHFSKQEMGEKTSYRDLEGPKILVVLHLCLRYFYPKWRVDLRKYPSSHIA